MTNIKKFKEKFNKFKNSTSFMDTENFNYKREYQLLNDANTLLASAKNKKSIDSINLDINELLKSIFVKKIYSHEKSYYDKKKKEIERLISAEKKHTEEELSKLKDKINKFYDSPFLIIIETIDKLMKNIQEEYKDIKNDFRDDCGFFGRSGVEKLLGFNLFNDIENLYNSHQQKLLQNLEKQNQGRKQNKEQKQNQGRKQLSNWSMFKLVVATFITLAATALVSLAIYNITRDSKTDQINIMDVATKMVNHLMDKFTNTSPEL